MKILFCTILFLSLSCHADSICLADYSTPERKPGKFIYAFSFEPEEKFQLIKADGIDIVERAGMNGTFGLSITRTDPRRYDIASLPLPLLKEGKTYTVEFSAKAEITNAKTYDAIDFFAVEFYRNGKHVTGEYIKGKNRNSWIHYTCLFTIPQNTEAQLSFYLTKGLTGKVTVDDITVRETGGSLASLLLTSPKNLTFHGGDTRYEILADTTLPVENIAVHVSLDRNGSVSSQIAKRHINGLYYGNFGKIPPGESTVTIRLLDTKLIVKYI